MAGSIIKFITKTKHNFLLQNFMQPIFITGIGTGVGKTIASAVVTEALNAHYWKPIQAGFEDGTDATTIEQLVSNSSIIHQEVYKLAMPASPHIAAKAQGISISVASIVTAYKAINTNGKPLVIEGAGGLLVPINENEFIIDMIKALQAKVILVSRNYLGSINHSLLTAQVCKANGIDVVGWIFNDNYLQYEQEIAHWTNLPIIGTLPFTSNLNKQFVQQQANAMQHQLTLRL
jgi:dethiobiotin synthetase